jgi:hypothetical protein
VLERDDETASAQIRGDQTPQGSILPIPRHEGMVGVAMTVHRRLRHVLVAGKFDTDIIDDCAGGTPNTETSMALRATAQAARRSRPPCIAHGQGPDVFARALAKALDRDKRPYVRRGIGIDAQMMMFGAHVVPSE